MLESGRPLAVGSALILRTSLGAVANRARWVMTKPGQCNIEVAPFIILRQKEIVVYPGWRARTPTVAGAKRRSSGTSLMTDFLFPRGHIP